MKRKLLHFGKVARRGRGIGLGLWLLAMTVVFASAQEAGTADEEGPLIPHTMVGRSNCLICHAEGFGDAVAVPADHGSYTNDDCGTCHQQDPAFAQIPALFTITEGAVPKPLEHPSGEGQNTCYDCHLVLDEKEHQEIAEEWADSVHGNVGVSCADCHGGDPRTDEMNQSMAPEVGFIGVPTRLMVPVICGGCHSDVERMRQYNLPTDQYAKYIESVHGTKVQQGDTKVALCTDCHGTHNVKKASDPSADVYPLNVPDLCARCHADANYMKPYDIPTNQYEVYQTSVHGQGLLIDQDLRAPTCASCHGSHAASPPDAEEVINVCGKCHTATQALYEESLHARIGNAAPKCWTCHGTHDVFKPDESMFIHEEPQEQHCGACHLDNESFRMDRSRFAHREDRRCDTCHHEGSMIMVQVMALRATLVEADQAFKAAEENIRQASARGMIVSEAEARLAEARTSLIRARATLHTTKLPAVSDLADDAKMSAESANEIATGRLDENIFRRRAMVIAIGVIAINVLTLSVYKRHLYQQLD